MVEHSAVNRTVAGSIPAQGAILLDLPYPPSINDLWKRGKGRRLYRSPKYTQWITEAGLTLIAQKPKLPCKAISGRYSMILWVSPKNSLADIGNLEKAVSDLLQAHGFIQNDNLCRKLMIIWEDNPNKLPLGCRVKLKPHR